MDDREVDFTCSNCGRQILHNVVLRRGSRIRDGRMYCSGCYYAVCQAVGHQKSANQRLLDNQKKYEDKIRYLEQELAKR